MLFDIAAFTSVALGPVAEAFGVHEISRYSLVQSWVASGRDVLPSEGSPAGLLGILPMAPPIPVIGPAPVTQPNELVKGIRLLQQLSLLKGSGISEYVTAHPDAINTLLASPPPTRDVTLWWSALDAQSQSALRHSAPQLVGNLEGVPFRVRDVANRGMLDSTIRDLDRLIGSDAGRSVVENARQQLKMLRSISVALDGTGENVVTGKPLPTAAVASADKLRPTLLTLDVTGQGRAAIVLGDLATADYVSFLVPGMFFTIENQMGDWVGAAGRLYDQQLSWLDYFDSANASTVGDDAAGPSVATVAWIGYHTPNLTNVGGIQNADEGRDALASAIMGLQSIRTHDEPYVTVIAHSYGSTAALMALTEYDFEVDALAMVGSPGSPAKSVAELHVRNGNVFVGEAAWDPIPNSSYFGSDPGSASYGARALGVTGNSDSLVGGALLASTGHNEYFSPGTESMRNFALISIGKGQFVSGGEPPISARAVAPRR